MIVTEKHYKKIEQNLDDLVRSISESRFMDYEDIKKKVFLFLRIMISDIRKMQVSEMEEERLYILQQIASDTVPEKALQKAKARIAYLDHEIKATNRTVHAFKQYNDYELLTKFIKNKYGENALIDFYIETKELNEGI